MQSPAQNLVVPDAVFVEVSLNKLLQKRSKGKGLMQLNLCPFFLNYFMMSNWYMGSSCKHGISFPSWILFCYKAPAVVCVKYVHVWLTQDFPFSCQINGLLRCYSINLLGNHNKDSWRMFLIALHAYTSSADFFKCKYHITFALNYDGAPKFKSSRVQLWPVHLYLNELPPRIRYELKDKLNILSYLVTCNVYESIRFCREQHFLAGIWCAAPPHNVLP